MRLKHLPGLLCAGLALAMSLALPRASAQAQKNPWASAGDVAWGNAGANGPGTSTKVLLTKENGMIDDTVRAFYKVKVDPGGAYTVAAAPDEDRIFFVALDRGVLPWVTSKSRPSRATYLACRRESNMD